MNRCCLLLLLTLLSVGCTEQIPTVRYRQYQIQTRFTIVADTISIYVKNSLKCPLRVGARSENNPTEKVLQAYFPMLLDPLQDTSLWIIADTSQTFDTNVHIRFPSVFGDPDREIELVPLSLPFPEGKSYSIIQGYNGSYSHQGTYSRYALDFDTRIGDTICAADKGVAVGVIEGYKEWGDNRKWRDFANYITLYHPHSGLFTQYVHLDFEGSLVAVGDSVKMGQPIGISGKTGWSSVEHLHFNSIVPKEKEFHSVPIEFLEGYKGSALKRKDRVKK
ncbi:MAG: M23 family metallopeptidase [Bacteroidota bacterium]